MSEKLKVFGGMHFREGRCVRAVIAATSQKKAARIIGVSMYGFRGYWTETGNKDEIALALQYPNTVVWTGKNYWPPNPPAE